MRNFHGECFKVVRNNGLSETFKIFEYITGDSLDLIKMCSYMTLGQNNTVNISYVIFVLD